ncbi:hypothetical protein BDK51DRAFT_26202 [Blyttiomyces helicus]|uniref:Uncharacterized protein n=1 Tax=Blyttiomyces helicus TaxID=388810 RepID=A0A4P9WMX1_9FUNG|nr:hypothetical protein BDK51DRAFT_26202 [Blyttiomyces helicus]|eukprot:RKO94419.1 hypothetical protein BDK51DRAFT_26202 [Blyttiomyces helicus]
MSVDIINWSIIHFSGATSIDRSTSKVFKVIFKEFRKINRDSRDFRYIIKEFMKINIDFSATKVFRINIRDFKSFTGAAKTFRTSSSAGSLPVQQQSSVVIKDFRKIFRITGAAKVLVDPSENASDPVHESETNPEGDCMKLGHTVDNLETHPKRSPKILNITTKLLPIDLQEAT